MLRNYVPSHAIAWLAYLVKVNQNVLRRGGVVERHVGTKDCLLLLFFFIRRMVITFFFC